MASGGAYQGLDYALIAGYLDDASLTTALNLVYNWQGFKGAMSDFGTTLSTPSTPPVSKLKAGGAWTAPYPDGVNPSLSNTALPRRPVVDIRIRVEPVASTDVNASSSSWTTALDAAEAIKDSFESQASGTGIAPIVTVPLAELRPFNGWPEFRLLIPVHSTL